MRHLAHRYWTKRTVRNTAGRHGLGRVVDATGLPARRPIGWPRPGGAPAIGRTPTAVQPGPALASWPTAGRSDCSRRRADSRRYVTTRGEPSSTCRRAERVCVMAAERAHGCATRSPSAPATDDAGSAAQVLAHGRPHRTSRAAAARSTGHGPCRRCAAVLGAKRSEREAGSVGVGAVPTVLARLSRRYRVGGSNGWSGAPVTPWHRGSLPPNALSRRRVAHPFCGT